MRLKCDLPEAVTQAVEVLSLFYSYNDKTVLQLLPHCSRRGN
jgi:hypothetical protein